MNLGIFQIIYLFLIFTSLGIHLTRNGEPRNDRYSFWSALAGTIINILILYGGGFFG